MFHPGFLALWPGKSGEAFGREHRFGVTHCPRSYPLEVEVTLRTGSVGKYTALLEAGNVLRAPFFFFLKCEGDAGLGNGAKAVGFNSLHAQCLEVFASVQLPCAASAFPVPVKHVRLGSLSLILCLQVGAYQHASRLLSALAAVSRCMTVKMKNLVSCGKKPLAQPLEQHCPRPISQSLISGAHSVGVCTTDTRREESLCSVYTCVGLRRTASEPMEVELRNESEMPANFSWKVPVKMDGCHQAAASVRDANPAARSKLHLMLHA